MTKFSRSICLQLSLISVSVTHSDPLFRIARLDFFKDGPFTPDAATAISKFKDEVAKHKWQVSCFAVGSAIVARVVTSL
jgi:hypothetical protein